MSTSTFLPCVVANQAQAFVSQREQTSSPFAASSSSTTASTPSTTASSLSLNQYQVSPTISPTGSGALSSLTSARASSEDDRDNNTNKASQNTIVNIRNPKDDLQNDCKINIRLPNFDRFCNETTNIEQIENNTSRQSNSRVNFENLNNKLSNNNIHNSMMSTTGTSRLTASTTFHSLDARSFRPFKTQDSYLYAMKEDLAEWFNGLYSDIELNVESFMSGLDNGELLCRHANNLTSMGQNFQANALESATSLQSSIEDQSTFASTLYDSSQKQQNLSKQQQPSSVLSHQNSSPEPPQLNLSSMSSSVNTSLTTSVSSSLSQSQFNPQSSSLSKLSTIDWFSVKKLTFRKSAITGSFFARDNISQFIAWCRSLKIRDCLLFETDDLVLRKNERSFILCLLEVSRIGFKVGMSTPLIIQLEQEIDTAIEDDARLEQQLMLQKQQQQQQQHKFNNNNQQEDIVNLTQKIKQQALEDENEIVDEEEEDEEKPQVITNDLISLHERVVELLSMCTCPTQFPMVRISDGLYRVGDKIKIFLRILRNHIMVRVGGGWDTFENYLDKHDPCRCRSLHHQRLSSSQSSTKLRQALVSAQLNKTADSNSSLPNAASSLPESSLTTTTLHTTDANTSNNNNSSKLPTFTTRKSAIVADSQVCCSSSLSGSTSSSSSSSSSSTLASKTLNSASLIPNSRVKSATKLIPPPTRSARRISSSASMSCLPQPTASSRFLPQSSNVDKKYQKA